MMSATVSGKKYIIKNGPRRALRRGLPLDCLHACSMCWSAGSALNFVSSSEKFSDGREHLRTDVGGEGGIRTHGTLSRTTVFETAPIDRSGTSPRAGFGLKGRRTLAKRV